LAVSQLGVTIQAENCALAIFDMRLTSESRIIHHNCEYSVMQAISIALGLPKYLFGKVSGTQGL
jgi:hypothetical protein